MNPNGRKSQKSHIGLHGPADDCITGGRVQQVREITNIDKK